MKEKNKRKEKAVKEMKYGILQKEILSAISGGISTLVFSLLSIFNCDGKHPDDVCGFSWRPIFYVIAFIFGTVSVILLIIIYRNNKKYRKDYDYYSESKRISTALLTAVKRTGSAKTNSILRSTYGRVPNWHPTDYCKNVLVYDVHEHLRDICIKMKELIVDLSPNEFNDDMVTVDIVFEYPSDEEFISNVISGLEFGNDCLICDVNGCHYVPNKCNLASLQQKLDVLKRDNGENTHTNCKVITSGDRTSSKVNLHDYFNQSNSFYKYLEKLGYAFCNDKKELAEDNHYIWSSKDHVYGRIGSIVGTVIELKNDNPEKVFVRVFLTITTYGRRLVDNKDLLDVETFEKLFKETVINSYKTIIETELAQMFIRHGINNCFIDRHKGKLCDKQDN